MKTQFTFQDSEPVNCDIEITDEHSASSHGIPVLVDEGGGVIDEMSWQHHRILYATPEELEQLKKLGLHTRHL